MKFEELSAHTKSNNFWRMEIFHPKYEKRLNFQPMVRMNVQE
jgi:hypothetical protein